MGQSHAHGARAGARGPEHARIRGLRRAAVRSRRDLGADRYLPAAARAGVGHSTAQSVLRPPPPPPPRARARAGKAVPHGRRHGWWWGLSSWNPQAGRGGAGVLNARECVEKLGVTMCCVLTRPKVTQPIRRPAQATLAKRRVTGRLRPHDKIAGISSFSQFFLFLYFYLVGGAALGLIRADLRQKRLGS